MIDTTGTSLGKPTYNFVIHSTDKIGTYNYDCHYNINFDTLLKNHNDKQKYRIKWCLGSVNTTAHAGDHMGILYIDFGGQVLQQDSKLSKNNIMGFVEMTYADANKYWLRHSYENTYTTIEKPKQNQIRVYFRTADNQIFNGDEGEVTTNLPEYVIKVELQPIQDE